MIALGWLGIVRLGLVQAAIGAIVVLTTSTLNRVMIVELALPAALPGALVALHYAVQVLRPRMGFGSDRGARRTPWIIGGLAVLAVGGVAAAGGTALMGADRLAGIALAVAGFVLIGVGVAAAGTSLLVLLSARVAPPRRAAAAAILWLMMIAGFAVTTTIAGHLLDPYSPARLVAVVAAIAGVVLVMAMLALWRIEGPGAAVPPRADPTPFRAALAQVWAEPRARRFTLFVFVSMLAYSAQDLVLEPFAGAVFALPPGASTRLAGVQHAGAMLGMVLVGVACFAFARGRAGSLRAWMVGGCVGSAAMLALLSAAAFAGPGWPLRGSFLALGVANGVFTAAAIGSMMRLASAGREARAGVRMGLWGAAQAIGFGLGGLAGTLGVDLGRAAFGAAAPAYAAVFALEAAAFLAAALMAARTDQAEAGMADAGRADATTYPVMGEPITQAGG